MKNKVDLYQDFNTELETELNKKDYYLGIYTAGFNYYNENELRFKMIIFLYEERVTRYNKILN